MFSDTTEAVLRYRSNASFRASVYCRTYILVDRTTTEARSTLWSMLRSVLQFRVKVKVRIRVRVFSRTTDRSMDRSMVCASARASVPKQCFCPFVLRFRIRVDVRVRVRVSQTTNQSVPKHINMPKQCFGTL